MSVIDVEGLLADVTADAPCGEDLSYDPAYVELERAIQGTPEKQVGDSVIAAEEPDWREVRKLALDLMGRTKDLRVTLDLTLALMKLEGLTGLRDGLALVGGLLEKHWESFHPQLDPDDDNDPTERMNIISSLAPEGGFQDPLKFPQRLLELPLCSSAQLGQFSMRSVMLAGGDLKPAGDETVPDPAHIDAAFATAEPEDLSANAAAIMEVEDALAKINARLEECVGAANAPDLDGFETPVKQIRQLLQQKAPQAFPGGGASAAGGAPSAGAEGGSVSSAEAGTSGALSGSVSSRDDVVRVLDLVCAYYSRHEPSSPVPLIIQRARRLVTKDFMEIIKDMSPDAVQQIQKVVGSVGQEGQG